MSTYIFDLVRQGEHDMLDFKHSITDAQKIAKSLVAFANMNGGKLLIGVKDNGTISGIRSDEEFYMIQTAAHLFCKPEIRFSTDTWYIDGKTVLEITIPKSLDKIYYAKDTDGKWRVFIRVNDSIFLANRILLKVWKQRRRKRGTYIRYEDTEQLLLDYLNEHKKITFHKFRKIANISPSKAERILVNLIVLNLIDIIFTDTGTFYTLKNSKQ
ncbi:MAG: putative DNA binding domain-containing protein [Bacteroidales bacterium]